MSYSDIGPDYAKYDFDAESMRAALREIARIAAACRKEPTKSHLGALGMIERAALAAVQGKE